MRRHFVSYQQEARIMGLIEQVSRYDPEVNAMRLARLQQTNQRVARTIAQMQSRKLVAANLDPMLTATALGALSHRFAEMWLVHGAIECTLDYAVDQLSELFVNALQIRSPPPA